MVSSFANQRLVLLYSRIGRIADAGRHLTALERTWKIRADPLVRGMLADAQTAVRAARAKGR